MCDVTTVGSVEKVGKPGAPGTLGLKRSRSQSPARLLMLQPRDRLRRDSTLFQFTTKQLRDFTGPNHLLIQIDGQPYFAKLVAPLEKRYCPDFSRPAIHGDTPGGDGASAPRMLDLQHRLPPDTVIGHLQEYCVQLVLLPDHRQPGLRPLQHHSLHRPHGPRGLRRNP